MKSPDPEKTLVCRTVKPLNSAVTKSVSADDAPTQRLELARILRGPYLNAVGVSGVGVLEVEEAPSYRMLAQSEMMDTSTMPDSFGNRRVGNSHLNGGGEMEIEQAPSRQISSAPNYNLGHFH